MNGKEIYKTYQSTKNADMCFREYVVIGGFSNALAIQIDVRKTLGWSALVST